MSTKYALVGILFLSACSLTAEPTQTVSSSAASSSVSIQPNCASGSNAVQYKHMSIGAFSVEIPTTWSTALLGDIGPMPYSDKNQGWLPQENIVFSIGEHGIEYGDAHEGQIDMAKMENDQMEKMINHLKTDKDSAQWWIRWEKTSINEIPVTIAYGVEEDTKSPGAVLYFFTSEGQILLKQGKGDEEFESGFKHLLSSMQKNPSVYFGPLNDQIQFE